MCSFPLRPRAKAPAQEPPPKMVRVFAWAWPQITSSCPYPTPHGSRRTHDDGDTPMIRSICRPYLLFGAVCVTAVAVFTWATGRATAQSCEPNPCGPGEICTCNYQFGPDGEAICSSTCVLPITCNSNGVCDANESQWTCPGDCPCSTSHTCAGYCGDGDDGCGNSLHCGACPQGCGDGICAPSEICTIGGCFFGPDGDVFCSPACIPNPTPTPTPSPTPTPAPTPTPTPPTGSNRPPVAAAGGPYSGRALDPILFDGSGSSDPDGNETITQYTWTFGDLSGQAPGRFVQHVYFTSGSYSVNLIVRDVGGLAAGD